MLSRVSVDTFRRFPVAEIFSVFNGFYRSKITRIEKPGTACAYRENFFDARKLPRAPLIKSARAAMIPEIGEDALIVDSQNAGRASGSGTVFSSSPCPGF